MLSGANLRMNMRRKILFGADNVRMDAERQSIVFTDYKLHVYTSSGDLQEKNDLEEGQMGILIVAPTVKLVDRVGHLQLHPSIYSSCMVSGVHLIDASFGVYTPTFNLDCITYVNFEKLDYICKLYIDVKE